MSKTTAKKSASKSKRFDDLQPEWLAERLERIASEVEKWTDDLQSRGDRFRVESQKRVEKSQKRVEKAIDQLQDELRKLPGVKRAEELRTKVEKQVEKNVNAGVDRVYSTLQIARQDELKKLDRKIANLNKKIRALEKQQAAA